MEGFLERQDTLDSRQFLIAVKRLADTLSYGTDASPFLGAGIEYVQSRPYTWGDPIRSIDWRVTARTGTVYVKEYEAQRRMPCYLLIDTSASMMVGSHAKTKYEIALHIAGGLALACLDRVSPVGILGVGERKLRVEPSLSKDQIMQWLLLLRRFRYDEGTQLTSRILELAPRLRSRALIVVLSDMHEEAAVQSLKRLAGVHDVALLHLLDPAEDGVRGAGFLRAAEAESGKRFVTTGRGVWIDPESQREAVRRGGIDYLRIRAHEPFVHRLRHFFATRALLGRGAR